MKVKFATIQECNGEYFGVVEYPGRLRAEASVDAWLLKEYPNLVLMAHGYATYKEARDEAARCYRVIKRLVAPWERVRME
jgi:hypothetical protein